MDLDRRTREKYWFGSEGHACEPSLSSRFKSIDESQERCDDLEWKGSTERGGDFGQSTRIGLRRSIAEGD